MSRWFSTVRTPRARAFVLAVLLAGLLAWPSCSDSPTTPSPPAPVCSFSLSTTGQDVAPEGGTVPVSVTTSAGCAWTAQSPASWVALSGTSFTGPGTVTLTAAANAASTARSANVTVAGQAVTISQAGFQVTVCAYAVTPNDVNIPAAGATGQIGVDTGATCSWDAVSDDNWITTAGTNPRTGPGSASYTVDPHTGPVGRLGRLHVAGVEVLVHQAAPPATSCSYKVEPPTVELAWYHTGGNVMVTTADGCTWTASTNASWLTLTTPPSMVGSGMATASMTTYKELQPREGMIVLRWPTATAGQNVVVRQYGCGYSVNPAIVNVPAAGGRASATVFGATQASFSMIECPWRLATAMSWIRLNTISGEGLSPVSFDVDANTTGQERCGSVVMSDPDVARGSFQVCQAK